MKIQITVDGPRGCGKTRAANKMIDALESAGWKIVSENRTADKETETYTIVVSN